VTPSDSTPADSTPADSTPADSAPSRPPATGQPPAAVLIGPPGAGKTTVGGLLARLLDVSYVDTDASVEAVAGKPVSDIFVEDGEPAFRELEREAVAAAVAGDGGPGAGNVVGLGGGAVLDGGTRALLAGQRVVYLETGFPELAKRVGMDKPRPLLIGINPRAQLKTLLEQRQPIYAGLARIIVPTDGRDPAEIAADVAALLAAPPTAAGPPTASPPTAGPPTAGPPTTDGTAPPP
jgi:shikimate kinase